MHVPNASENANFLGKKGLVGALLSRLRHQCHTVKIDGPSLREEVERAVFAYVDAHYNTRRPHSALGYLTPNEYEQQAA